MNGKGIYVVVDTNVTDHPRFQKAGLAAVGLWTLGLAYTRKHELDGRVPKTIAHRMDPDAPLLASRLVECGLWEDCGDDYLVLRYAEKGNQTRAQIAESRAKARERVARFRMSRVTNAEQTANERILNANVPVSISISDSEISDPRSESTERAAEHGQPCPNPEPCADHPRVLPPPSEASPREQEYQRAYEQGVEAGKKTPFAMTDKARGALHQAIQTFAKDKSKKALRGQILLDWVKFQSEAFARWLANSTTEESKFWSEYQPTGFLRWANAGRCKPFPGLKALPPPPDPERPSEVNLAAARAIPDLVPTDDLNGFMATFARGFGR